MRVTTKGRYAIRAMANLAQSGTGVAKSIRLISAEEKISPEFLEQIFYKLKKAGIIGSNRGPTGGFFLARPAADVNIKEILLAVDEGLSLTPCTNCGEDPETEPCTNIENCRVMGFWQETSRHITAYFETHSLQDIIDRNRPAPLSGE